MNSFTFDVLIVVLDTHVSQLFRFALQLGGINWDKFLRLKGSDNVNPHQQAELVIARIRKNRKKEDLILSLNIIIADELGQLSAEEIALFEIF